ncbi:MAG: DUF362 domain-containing protein [Candidatus Aminicenantes bacterium]|nr:DUF362 domain-containing protein [Candidatus Aminicenantes bacterium]
MPKKIGRREFIKSGAALGASVVVGGKLLAKIPGGRAAAPAAGPAAVNVVSGTDWAAMTAKAVELAGGMSAFVAKGAKVALLPNVQSKHPGTFTKPDILRTVIRLCKQAGAAEVACLSYLGQANWDGTGLAQVIQEEGAVLRLIPREDEHWKPVAIPGAAALAEARLMKALDGYGLWINMPITKDHAGNKFTGTMKNLMGINQPTVNRAQFHKPNWKTDPNDIAHLEKCIVDLNFAAKPALNIVDATEIIKTNGPMGPGELIKPGKIVAGVDRVAVDSYCATLLGFKGEEIVAIRHAAERKLGEIDLQKAGVREVAV